MENLLFGLAVWRYEREHVRGRNRFTFDQHRDGNKHNLIYSHHQFVCVAERTPARSTRTFQKFEFDGNLRYVQGM